MAGGNGIEVGNPHFGADGLAQYGRRLRREESSGASRASRMK